MKKARFLLLIVLLPISTLFIGSCSDDDDNNNPIPESKKSGFVLVTQVGLSTVESFFSQFSEEFPTGAIDNTQGKSFENFFVRGQLGNELYVNTVDQAKGVSKVVVSATGEIEVIGELATIDAAFPVEIVDSNTGYLDDRNDLDIEIFNPSTMMLTGSIDMSSALVVPQADDNIYQEFIVRDDKMFVAYRPRKGTAYASDSLIFHVIDLTTNTFEKSIVLDGHKAPVSSQDPIIDEQGNIYIATQGDLTVPNLFRPSIVKIPAGSTEFDPEYNFKPIDLTPLGAGLPIQVLTQFIYDANGIAYIVGGVEVPPTILQLFAEKGGPFDGNWTPADFGIAFDALRTEPSAKWIEVDLNAQTINIIDDIPLTSPFSGANASKIGANFYFSVVGDQENAFYQYTPSTKTGIRAFQITDGGIPAGLYDLSQN
ncbi:MAG: hypothetical protein AAGI07_04465 [Bacteroidota bacterium]